MVKRHLEGENVKLYETVRECLEEAVKEEELIRCYYFFETDGGCWELLIDSTSGHVVKPEEMIRIAEKFFNEFGWVHFEGWGKNGEAYINCYFAEETKESFIERQMKNKEKRIRKIIEQYKIDHENKVKNAHEKAVHAYNSIEEWKES